jgi:hypothetical protein
MLSGQEKENKMMFFGGGMFSFCSSFWLSQSLDSTSGTVIICQGDVNKDHVTFSFCTSIIPHIIERVRSPHHMRRLSHF